MLIGVSASIKWLIKDMERMKLGYGILLYFCFSRFDQQQCPCLKPNPRFSNHGINRGITGIQSLRNFDLSYLPTLFFS